VRISGAKIQVLGPGIRTKTSGVDRVGRVAVMLVVGATVVGLAGETSLMSKTLPLHMHYHFIV
jgi:hypothetical protein